MERVDKKIDDLHNEYIICLGSYTPIKKWCKLKFGSEDDVFYIPYEGNIGDEDATLEHISIHSSGKIHREIRSAGRVVHENFYEVGRGKMKEIRIGTTRLEEDYIYRSLPTLTEKNERNNEDKNHLEQKIIPCLDRKLVNSILSYSIMFVVSAQSKYINNAVDSYLKGKKYRAYAYVFQGMNRSIIVCMVFSGGDKAIKKSTQEAVDKLPIKRKILLQFEKLSLGEAFSIKEKGG